MGNGNLTLNIALLKRDLCTPSLLLKQLVYTFCSIMVHSIMLKSSRWLRTVDVTLFDNRATNWFGYSILHDPTAEKYDRK